MTPRQRILLGLGVSLIALLTWQMLPRYQFFTGGTNSVLVYRVDRWTGQAFIANASTRVWKPIYQSERNAFDDLPDEVPMKPEK